jgi:hypothetical protein
MSSMCRLINRFIGVVVIASGVNLLSSFVVAQKWAWLPPPIRRTGEANRIRVDPLRKTAFVAGLIYLVTLSRFRPSRSTGPCGTIKIEGRACCRSWAKLRPPTFTSFARCGATIQWYYVPVVSNAE